MKKLLYILLFASISASAITSCTEEEVAPSAASGTEAGVGVDPK